MTSITLLYCKGEEIKHYMVYCTISRH